jgi:hypothetical protein
MHYPKGDAPLDLSFFYCRCFCHYCCSEVIVSSNNSQVIRHNFVP